MIELLNHMVAMLLRRPTGKRLARFVAKCIRQCYLRQYVVFGDESRVSISARADVQNALFNTVSGRITIEDYVFFGHNVSLITGSHEYHNVDSHGRGASVRSGRDILIKEGAWLATNVTVTGPCTIGEYSVVAACSLVRKDVPPYAFVAGVPAQVIRMLNEPCDSGTASS